MEVRQRALRPEGLRSRPVRMDPVFDDPDAILALMRRRAPYKTLLGFTGHDSVYGTADVPWFMDQTTDEPLLMHNPRWIEAAREAFDAEIVRPMNCTLNVNAPAKSGPPHLDLPVYRGLKLPEAPMWLLTNMSRSRLFLPWLVPLATGLMWFWRGAGGEFEYWPDGPDAPSVCARAPLWNVGVMSDNEVMWHRVGAIGAEERRAELVGSLPSRARIHSVGEGWELREDDHHIASYGRDEIRLSLVWKAYVFKDAAHLASFEDKAYDLDLDTVVDIYAEDLEKRGIDAPRPRDPLADPEWRKLIERVYRTPFD